METNDIIKNLVNDLRPVKTIRPFAARFAVWMASGAVVIVALLLFAGLRRDLELVLRSWGLLVDAGLILLLAAAASFAALRMSVPGEENALAHRVLPAGLFGLWILYSFGRVAADAVANGVSALIPDAHLACAALLLLGGALGAVPLAMIIRSAAPLDPRWCGAAAGLAASAVTMVGIELICVYERPAHMAAWHAIPVALFTAAGALLGPSLLSRRS